MSISSVLMAAVCPTIRREIYSKDYVPEDRTGERNHGDVPLRKRSK